MLTMSKKKTKPADATASEEDKPTPILFRPDSQDLVDALKAWAGDNRRSVNLAMVILLEKALRAEGYFPPPAAP